MTTPKDPLRTQIYARLQHGSATSAQLAAAIGKPWGIVYAELSRMKGDGLVDATQLAEGGARWWTLR